MTTYKCNDGNGEIEIEADTAQEAAQEYVDGGDWGEVIETVWVNVHVQEVIECDHNSLTDGECDECGESCSGADVGAEADGICHEEECPIHGSVERLGEHERYKISVDPEEPSCPDHDEHDWQSPFALLGGIKENPGVWGNAGGVIVKEVCMHCGCKKTTDTWAQDPETGEQGLTSIEYERDAFDLSELADEAEEDC